MAQWYVVRVDDSGVLRGLKLYRSEKEADEAKDEAVEGEGLTDSFWFKPGDDPPQDYAARWDVGPHDEDDGEDEVDEEAPAT
jgi:hypothetical protein